MEKENTEAPETEVLEPSIDLNTPEGKQAYRIIIAEEERLKRESESTKERNGIDLSSAAANDPKPEVKGERVTHWQLRGFRGIQAVAGMTHADTSFKARSAQNFEVYNRQYFAMADSQREAEHKEALNIVQAAVDDGFISRKGGNRIINFLDDPKEREFLSEQRLHSTLTGPAGEFIVPKPMLATIYTIIEEYGLAQRLGTNITMESKDLELNSIATANSAAWVGEAALFTESDLALGQNILSTHKLGAVSSISMEQQEDQLTPLIPVWLRKLGEDIAQKIDASFFLGDGTSTYGNMLGITNQASVQSFTAGSGDLAPADIVENDLDQVVRLLTTVRRRRAQWVMPRILWDYVRKFESGVGARIVQEMLQNLPQQRYDGFPVNLSEAMDNTNGDVANRDFAILGDFSNALVGTRRGITVETSTDAVLSNSSGVVTFNAFQQDGMLVKISLRIGHQVPTGVQDGFAILNAPAS